MRRSEDAIIAQVLSWDLFANSEDRYNETILHL
jgi:hypothetical protein